MDSTFEAGSNVFPRRVIGFEREMQALDEWLDDPDAGTLLYSISGIGGIGKTTLLTEIADRCRQSGALTLWLDGQGEMATSGAFLSSLEMSLESEYGRIRKPETPLLPFILSEVSGQRSVLVMDNCERLDRIESWLLSRFLPHLPAAGVLIAIASRSGLPVKWRTNPYWSGRILSFPLNLFTREQVHEYLRGSGLAPEVQRDIARKTDGHPLLLALTVDLLRSRQDVEDERSLLHIPAMLSAEILREAASPILYEALTILSLLPAADQSVLNFFLDTPIDSSGYHELGKLSFVRAVSQGFELHHVVSRLLREDFARRDPDKFQALRHRIFQLLAERFHAVDRRMQMRIAAHVLEIYREFLPAAHAYADFSSTLKSGEHKPYQPEDLPSLHRFLSVSLAQSDWQSELVRREDDHDLLEDIAWNCPEGIFVVRDDGGTPLAFNAALPLHASTVPLLERYVPEWLAVLGEEGTQLRSVPPEAADTFFMLLAAVDVNQTLYRAEELGALLLQQWLIHMTGGLRAIMASADPQLNALLLVMGFRECGRVASADAGKRAITIWVLDFRQMKFEEWVQSLIRETGPGAREGKFGFDPGPAGIAIDEEQMKQILQHLYDNAKLAQIPAIRKLNIGGASVREKVREMLTAEEPPHPLTPLEQSILRDTYLRKERNKNQLADDYHMSRTTFYRHSRLAVIHLAHAWAHSSFH
ncbi:bacterio-opsin activator [Cohnella caldifontis]|uniref:bacterio-opsin activator n=1 Tax=Cohnella caldifontis TaxID=3027471 RepID=UPI0023ED6DA5|nr:bacterio-opsin activator [Cohnella sp. YIM B05605]